MALRQISLSAMRHTLAVRRARRFVGWLAVLLPGILVVTAVAAGGVRAQDGSFTFAAAGDIGGRGDVVTSLQALAAAETGFFLALGDLSYNEIRPESAWCSLVQEHVGETYPFQLLVGNHEERPTGDDGFIDEFAACLPDRLGVTGEYAHRYYFDYPAGAPLARFILIDPGLLRGSTRAHYCTGGDVENCDWLKARIAEAQAAGLWTIVGMHLNCLTLGFKSCEAGEPLLNLLVEHKVDLVLQGHDHTYQRSKQLALGAGCPSIAANAINPSCIADDGSDGHYARGAGMVFIIDGVFGQSVAGADPADPEAEYMAAWMASGELSYGFMKFTVTRDSLAGEFVNTKGRYTDRITIAGESIPPTPAATPVPVTGTPEPTPTPTAAVTPTPPGVPPAGDEAHLYFPYVAR